MKNFLLVLVILMAGFTYGQTTYVVSGAGSEECNGEYVVNGSVNGKTSYIYEGTTTFYLYCDSYEEYWCISASTSDDYDNSYYYVYSADDTPPSTGWEDYYGYSPAPTVILKAPTLIYSSNVFYESDENDGTISNSLTITYSFNESDSFSGTNGTFSTSNYTTSNVPDGLTVIITKNSETELSVTLTGTASSHTNTQDVSTMEIAFNNSAFTGGDASAVTNATKSDIEVDFFQDYYVAASGGDFTSITEAVAVADDRDIINIAAGTYTESGISIIEKELTILGAGAATTIIQASATANTASDRVFRIEASTIKIKDITIQNGKVTGVGAGIYPSSTNLTLENVALLNNTATLEGGAVRLLSSTVSIKNCTFTGNSTGQYGGGISCNGGVTTISNTTIAENSASLNGGAIFIQGESISIINCTIANNTTGGICFNSGTLSISNTILANNTSSDYYFVNVGTLNDNGYNIVENQSSSGATGTWYFHQSTDILYSHDYLGNTEGASGLGWNRNNVSISGSLNLSSTLADNNTTNGTQTLALTSGSFAINAGTDTDAPTTDQRGVSRNGTTDIGAYEWTDDSDPDPAIIYVNAAMTDNIGDGASWTTAFKSFQYGLNAAESGDQIWVAKGIYYPSSGYDFCDDSGDSTRFYHFRMIDGVTIYGGFAGTETAINQRANYGFGETNETILSGDIGIADNSTDNSYHIIYNVDNDTTAILNGFTITDGNADGESYESNGAGITNDNSSAKLVNCTITANTAAKGGGVYNYTDATDAPIFYNCTIMGNSAEYGGGIYNDFSSPSFTNCTIISNSATEYYGGGMYNNDASPTLNNCTVSSNSADGCGGGIYNCNSSAATLTNCTFSENSAYDGGGIYNDASAPVMNNCTFSENTAYYGGGIYNNNSSNPTLTGCIVSANSAIDGGGFYNNSASPSLTNCKISDNSSNNFGGGMYNYYSTPTMTNCLLITNSASYGGGTYENYSTSSTFINSTFSGNSARTDGGGLYIKYSTPILKNCIVWGNQATNNGDELFVNGETTTLNYSCYANATGDMYVSSGTFSPDEHCITADPRFVDTTAVDYRLCGNSPVINAGYNTYNSVTTDLHSQSRIQNTNIDMGAYEWTDGTDPDFAIIYVNAAKDNDNGSGGSWTNAKKTLQAALDRVISDDQIWVAKGTYYPTSAYDLTNSSRYYHFQMLNNVAIYGGFAGTETATDQRVNYGYGETNESILSGDIGISNDNTDNCYHVIFNPDQTTDIDTTAILDGFTITAANADGGSPHDQGAGIYNNYSSPSFINCTITANSAEYNNYGGGVFNYYSSPHLTNCEITSNSGGGIINEYSSSTFTGCTISENSRDYGGGVYNYYYAPIFYNCTISENSGNNGGGVFNDNSAPTFTNCLINNNSAVNNGGGLYNEFSAPILINCTIALNSADSSGGGLYNDLSSPRLKNCIIWDNEATVSGNEFYIIGEDSTTYLYNSCYANETANVLVNSGRFIPDGYCLTGNPKFVDPSNDDLRLCGNSPVVNVCDNNYNGLPTDLRGQNRIQDTYTDMGAYEWTSGIDPDAAIIFVDADKSNDNGYGSSWGSAKKTLQAALDLAVSGDQIWVAEGNYYPTSAYDLTNSSRYYHFRMIEGVAIYGGFGGSEVAESFNLDNRDFVNNTTILSGDIGISDNNSDNCYHVFYHPEGTGLTNAAVLDGFTITGGNANSTGNPHYYGGGIYNYSSSPILNNITISNNSASTSGGGMYNTTSSSPILTNCLIADNSAGGVANVNSSPVLTNCTITANSAANGGGVYNLLISSPVFNNCIVWGNTASSNGDELFITSGTTTLNYCCYSNSSGDVYNLGSTFSTTNNNITSDPGFVGSSFSAEHPYTIGSSSPCADAGLDSYNSQSRDIRGKNYLRKLDKTSGETGTIDIGAYEWCGEGGSSPTGSDSLITINEDELHTFAESEFPFSDSDGDTFAGIKIESVETAGVLKYNNADVTIGLECPNVTLLTFSPVLNASGVPYATFTFKVKDNQGILSTAAYTYTINVNAGNDAPVLAAIEGAALNYTENDAATIVTNNTTVTDVDDTNIESAVVQITNNYQSGQDVLSFTNQLGITGTWTVGTGTLALSGSAVLADYQTALRAVKYKNTSENPGTLSRTVSFTVNDGTVNSNTVTRNIEISSVNDLPTSSDGTINIVKDQTYTFVVSNFAFNDPDGDTFSGIKIETLETAGTLKYDGDDVTIGLECPDVTKLQFTPALNILSSPYASFTYKVKDSQGNFSTVAYIKTINVVEFLSKPVVTINTGCFVNEGCIVSLNDTMLKSTDEDGPSYSLIYEVVEAPQHGTLPDSVFTQNDLANGKIKYTHNGDEAVADTFKFVVKDEDGGISDETLFQITIINQNDAPVLEGMETDNIIYVAGQGAVNVTSSLAAKDNDNETLKGASVSIGGYVKGEDHLSFSSAEGIEVIIDEENGSVSFEGEASLETYQSILTSVSYLFTTAASSSNRSVNITFIVRDDSTLSNSASREIEIKAPQFLETNASITPPGSVEARYNSEGDMIITWKDQSGNELGFILYRNQFSQRLMKTTEDEYEVIALIPKDTEEYIDTTVVEGVKYSYKVSVYNEAGHSDSDSCLTNVEKVLLPPCSLTATLNNNNEVELSWSDNSEMEEGYIIERKASEDYTAIGSVTQNGTIFVDNNTVGGETYYYRVKGFGNQKESEYCDEAMVTITIVGIEKLEGVPTEYTLYQNYPNPFNPTTTIRYGIPVAVGTGHILSVQLRIYDILGREVATLVNEQLAPGYYEVKWNADNLSSGIYFYVLQAGSFIKSYKMMLLK